MATYDARPSQFTQMTTMAEWEYFTSVISGINAIDASVGSAMAPSLDVPGRNAVMADGVVVVKGQLWRADAPVSTPIPAASAQTRIDRLVIRLTRGATTSATVVQPVIITGTPSSSPQKPSLIRTTTGIWDIPVSYWTSSAAGGITNMVDDRHTINDPWHDMRPLQNSWVGSNSGYNPPQYRFGDDGNWVEVTGWIKNPSSGTWDIVPFFTLPANYRTTSTSGDRWAINGAQGTNNYSPCVQSWPNGDLTVESITRPLPANSMICVTGRFALPGPAGLIVS